LLLLLALEEVVLLLSVHLLRVPTSLLEHQQLVFTEGCGFLLKLILQSKERRLLFLDLRELLLRELLAFLVVLPRLSLPLRFMLTLECLRPHGVVDVQALL
jgi:hypothetical protein